MAERGQRRSARISALEASKAQQQAARGPGESHKRKEIEDGEGQEDSDTVQELPARSRGRKKRKLRTVEEVVVSSVERAVEQVTEIPKHEDQPSNTVEPSTLLSTSQKPDKRLCELIIDILQTRDRRGIFSVPVGPEVEHYYEIIKQPMDFGTMKTKLQNGMYKTLEEFKNDILLISTNAMHFNEQGNFYFNQGYNNYRLAMKLFNALKAHPENYEVAFSRLRPRPAKTSKKPGTSRATKDRRNGTNNVRARRGRPRLNGNIQSSNNENFSGGKDDELNRRISKPWNSFLNRYESVASSVYESSKQLVNVSNGYEESLMRYVKDLGPTAQMVAKRKLLARQVSAPNGQIASTSTQRRVNPPNNIINIPTSQNLFNNFSGLPTLPNPQNNLLNISASQNLFKNFSALPTVSNPAKSAIKIPPSRTFVNKSSGVPTVQSPNTGNRFDIRGAFRGETSHQNQSSSIQVGSHFPSPSARGLKFPENGMANSSNGYFSTINSGKFDNNPSADLASDMSQSRLLEYMCRQNNISRSSSSHFQAMMEDNSTNQASSSRHDLAGSHSYGEENPAITTVPGSSYRNNPVPKWNQSSLVSHSLGVEQNQARVAPSPTYGTSSAPFGHAMEWNAPSLGTNSLGGENLVMAAPGPSFVAGSSESDQVLEWNRASSGSHTLSSGVPVMDAPGVRYEIKSSQASFAANSLSGGNQEMGAPSVVQASSVPDWNQQSFGSHFLGGENQAMDVSRGDFGIELTQGGSVPLPIPTPILEWNQQRGLFPQTILDMEYLQDRINEINSFDQNGLFQPADWRLGSVPGTTVGQMGLCGRDQTHGHQSELNNLALLDSHQQPDLALQL